MNFLKDSVHSKEITRFFQFKSVDTGLIQKIRKRNVKDNINPILNYKHSFLIHINQSADYTVFLSGDIIGDV